MATTSLPAIPPVLLKEPAAASYLSISPRKLCELADDGKVDRVYIGAAKLYPVAGLKAFAESLSEAK